LANLALIGLFAGLFAVLGLGTLVRVIALRNAPPQVARPSLKSLATWWVLAIVLVSAVLLGRWGPCLLLFGVSMLGLREFVILVDRGTVDRATKNLVFGLAIAYYACLAIGYEIENRELAPAVFLVVLGAARAILGHIVGYIRTTAALFWGLMLLVYALSHAYFLLDLAPSRPPAAGHVGWFLYLVLLTETNDIAQALIGRSLGKIRITPRISPHKTLEGLVGGVLVTILVGTALAPWLTTWNPVQGPWQAISVVASGIVIACSGFLGDIHMSGVKRDVGVKDGSQLLPGQGGMIDRIDSLTFSAPAFYYFVRIAT
jgi:phosphatidate cytidylyltransferase